MQLNTNGIDESNCNYLLKSFLMSYKRYYPQISPPVYYYTMTRRFNAIISDPATTVQMLEEDGVIVAFQIYRQTGKHSITLYMQHVKSLYTGFGFERDLISVLPPVDLILLPVNNNKLKTTLSQLLPNVTITICPLEIT